MLFSSHPAIQDAKPAVAVGQEWTHAQCVGQGQGLLVGGFSQGDCWRMALCVDCAQELEGVRLVATFLVLTSKRQRTLGEGPVPPPNDWPTYVPPPGRRKTAERLHLGSRPRYALLQGLREERHGVSASPV